MTVVAPRGAMRNGPVGRASEQWASRECLHAGTEGCRVHGGGAGYQLPAKGALAWQACAAAPNMLAPASAGWVLPCVRTVAGLLTKGSGDVLLVLPGAFLHTCLHCAGDDGLPEGVGEEASDKDHVLPGAHVLPVAALPLAAWQRWIYWKLQECPCHLGLHSSLARSCRVGGHCLLAFWTCGARFGWLKARFDAQAALAAWEAAPAA